MSMTMVRKRRGRAAAERARTGRSTLSDVNVVVVFERVLCAGAARRVARLSATS